VLAVHIVQLRRLHCYFSFPGALKVVGSFAKLGETFAHGASELRQLARAEKYQGNDKNKEQLSAAERFKNERKHNRLTFLKISVVRSLRGWLVRLTLIRWR